MLGRKRGSYYAREEEEGDFALGRCCVCCVSEFLTLAHWRGLGFGLCRQLSGHGRAEGKGDGLCRSGSLWGGRHEVVLLGSSAGRRRGRLQVVSGAEEVCRRLCGVGVAVRGCVCREWSVL